MSRGTQRHAHTDRQERRLHFDVRRLVVFLSHRVSERLSSGAPRPVLQPSSTSAREDQLRSNNDRNTEPIVDVIE